MAYTVDFRPAARRQFLRLTPEVQSRLRPRIDALAEDPRPPGCKKLQGQENLWRIRIGDYRVVYRIQETRLIILVLIIGHRKDVYR